MTAARHLEPERQRWLVATAATTTVLVVASQTTRIFSDGYRVWGILGAAAAAAALVTFAARAAWPIRVIAGIVGVAGAGAIGVITHDGSLPSDLGDAIVSGINQVVAAVWPSPALPAGTGAIALTVALAAVMAVELAVHARPAAALAPSLGLIGLTALLSAPAGAPPMWSISAWCVAALLVFRWQHLGGRARVGRSWAAAILATSAALPVLLGGIASSDRYDPRNDVDRPSTAQDALSPLARVDEWRNRSPQEVMFTSDLAEPARWRLVGLTRYDGLAWLPADDYRRAGGDVGEPLDDRPTTDATVTIGSLDSLWLPTTGNALSVSDDVRVDGGRSGLLPLVEPVTGDEYSLVFQANAALPAQLSAAPAGDSAGEVLADGYELPTPVLELATTITAGTRTDFERAQAIATYLRDQYVLDEDTPSGHSMAVIDLFLDRTRRGRDEQFVAAYGVLAAAAGLPVRIAVGFDTVPTSDGGTQALSVSATAWPEVEFVGFGWVRFDPVPESTADAPPGTGDGAVAPVDDAITPPPQTTIPNTPESTVPPDEVDTTIEIVDADGVSAAAIRVAAGGGLLVVVAVGYTAVVLGLKRRRRRRRRSEAMANRRARGAFSSGVDVLIDAGVRPRRSSTDRELVSIGGRTVGDAAGLLAPAADAATAAVFDPFGADSVDADQAWEAVERFEDQVAAQMGPVRWWRSKLSLRSLRRGLPD
jgi:hypothetical protein